MRLEFRKQKRVLSRAEFEEEALAAGLSLATLAGFAVKPPWISFVDGCYLLIHNEKHGGLEIEHDSERMPVGSVAEGAAYIKGWQMADELGWELDDAA